MEARKMKTTFTECPVCGAKLVRYNPTRGDYHEEWLFDCNACIILDLEFEQIQPCLKALDLALEKLNAEKQKEK
jgi:ssDNA-binding Zn-finger/Zn-ribbon topoisomerase 1